MEVLLGILVFAVIATIAVFVYLAEKKRREELAQLARDLGWSFSPRTDRQHDDQYSQFEIFRRGHSRVAKNTLRGKLTLQGVECKAKAGDFSYKITTHNGKSTQTTTYHFSYLIVHLPFRGVPELLIRREGIFDKIAGAFGFEDIDFESVEFSKKFYVKSSDKRFAYDVIHARMMEFLLAKSKTMIDIEHDECCVADGKRRWKPGDFRQRIRLATDFMDLWPEHVVQGLRAEDS